MTLAEDKRPETTLLHDVSYYAFQSHEHVVINIGRVLIRCQLKISEAMPDSENKGKVLNNEELLKHIVTKL